MKELSGRARVSKSAFNWDVYKNRRTALQYLRRNCTLMDTILECEDGSSFEMVHSQVISAFGNLNNYIETNGAFVTHYRGIASFGNNCDLLLPCPEAMHALGPEPAGEKATVIPEVATPVVINNSDTGGQPLLNRHNQTSHSSRWPGKIKLIRLPHVNRYTLGILVDCAYTGYIRTDLQSGGIWQVLEMAEFYQMLEVIKACCAFLMKNLDMSNSIQFYHIGSKYKHSLQRAAWHTIRANFKHLLARELASPSPPQQQQVSTSGPQQNSLACLKYEHFEAMILHDKLNVDSEESVWDAIRLWCHQNLVERRDKLPNLLPCMRFPRFRGGTDFSARSIWRDPLVLDNPKAQHQLALLDRNHRDFLAGSVPMTRDGFNLPAAAHPRQLRPRIPQSILLAIGGWRQGQPTTLIESYDINCNLWFESRRQITSNLAYHGIEYINGLLYICGGTNGSDILEEVFTFDPVTGSCHPKPSMREPRCYVSTSFVAGHLYAMGGHNGQHRMKSVERFDLVGEAWVHVKEMNVARSDASACVHRDLIYIAGGLNDQVIENSVEFYNHQDDSWTFLSSMATPRTSFTLLMYNDSLLAIGGNNGTERLASVEQYNFETRTWSLHSEMRHRRSTFSATIVDRSKLIVVGGYNGQTPFNQVEMYSEASREWVNLQKIRFDRSGLKVVAVSSLSNATEYTFLGASPEAATYGFYHNQLA